MTLLIITCILKILTGLCLDFCKSCLQCSSSEKVLIKHGEDCLMINGGQNVKLEKGFIEFKNFN